VEPFKLTPDPGLVKDLCGLIETLRGPDGCPWDRKQTPHSIIGYLLEEGYELTDAVVAAEPAAVMEEIGDVLFLLLFLVQLYGEKNDFDLNAVLAGVLAKMVRRHPHVFSDLVVEDTAEVSRNWAKIKQAEKPFGQSAALLDRIPHATPALIRARRISAALADAGLDSRAAEDVWLRIESAMSACRQSSLQAEPRSAHFNYGELLWALVAWGRITGVDPEKALADSLDRLEVRLQDLEDDPGAARLKADAIESAQPDGASRLFE